MELMETAGPGIADRKRVEAVVDTLARVYREDESLAELAHDARNMVTALSLYCDLLDEPGVLSTNHRHYSSELRLVTEASRRLVEKLTLLDDVEVSAPARTVLSQKTLHDDAIDEGTSIRRAFRGMASDDLIRDLRQELLANRNVLAAIAGPAVTLTVYPRGGALPVRMTSEDLTRVLVNLVKNAAESMHSSGTVEIALVEQSPEPGVPCCVVLSVQDTGPGIADELLERIFEAGYTAKSDSSSRGDWPARHQGLGLSITRSLIEAAGGRIHAENSPQGGASIEMELPVRSL